MQIVKEIKAVAFDIDGTLYPNRRFFIAILPFILKNFRLMNAFRIVRHELRKLAEDTLIEDFYQKQAELMIKHTGIPDDANYIKAEIANKIYKGWAPLFQKIKPYKNVFETIQCLKQSGLKIALLSDFPIEQKGDVWGILPLCDCSLSSEETGALKPSPVPFKALAEKLELPAENILYVGNSVEYDVTGAANYGMKTAYICSKFKRAFTSKNKYSDFRFSSYKELEKILLKERA
ncbi:MAG: phosphoglycolate phosphatase [Treponema sp.]|nr:MAG: phosphoglycolate phosphatase [Treponema sp.]